MTEFVRIEGEVDHRKVDVGAPGVVLNVGVLMDMGPCDAWVTQWPSGERVPFHEACKRHGVVRKQVKARCGPWVVTTYGLECLKVSYAIEKARLLEASWLPHMAEKKWVGAEFVLAYLRALKHHYPEAERTKALGGLIPYDNISRAV